MVRLHVQPGARRNAIVGRYGDAIKIAVTAPPTGGRANEAIVTMFAIQTGLARRDVVIEQGARGRRKRVRLIGADRAIAERLLACAQNAHPG